MLVECIAIFAIILAIIIIFLRTKKEYASLTVPLLFIPGGNIIASAFSKSISDILPLDHFFVFLIINIIALIISGIVIGVQSNKFKTRKVKVYYSTSILLFNLILSTILMYNIYSIYM